MRHLRGEWCRLDKSILNDYIDACAFIKDTETEIKKLEKKKRIVQDRVRGSNPEWPYEPISFNLGGTVETVADAGRIQHEKRLLSIQKDKAEDLKLQVEEWMQEIPFRMNRIITYKIFKDLTWEEVATLMGRKATADSIRMEFNNFMKN